MTKQNKLEVKDLIQIGMFTAIYFVLIAPPGILGIIPIFMVLLPAMIGLIGGVPIMLMIAKTQKFGALSICGIIITLILVIMGHPWVALLLSIPTIVLADGIMAMGRYQQRWWLYAGYVIFSMWSIGNFIPFYFMRKAYLSFIEEKYGVQYQERVALLFSTEMIPIILLTTVIGASLGYFISSRLLKKHFKRAGML